MVAPRLGLLVASVACAPAVSGCERSSPGPADGAAERIDASSGPPDAAADTLGSFAEEAPGDAGMPAPTWAPLPSQDAAVTTAGMGNLVPLPVSVDPDGGAFVLPSTAAIRVDSGSAELTAIGDYLASKLRPSTGYALPVASTSGAPCPGDLLLTTLGGRGR